MSKIKTSPFSIQSNTNAYQSFSGSKSKRFIFYSKGLNKVNSFLLLSTIVLSFIVAYLFITINQLEKVVYLDNIIERISSPVNIVQVNKTEELSLWKPIEIKLNGNIVWNFSLPENFIESITNNQSGLNVFNGIDSNINYRIELEYPLFTEYKSGVPKSLLDWITKEESYYSSTILSNLKKESFSINGINSTLIYNTPRVISVSENSKQFDFNKKVFTLYTDSTNNKNFSKITFIPLTENTDSETQKAFVNRVISSIKF